MKTGIKIALIVLFSFSLVNYTNHYGLLKPVVKINQRKVSGDITEIKVKLISVMPIDSGEIIFIDENNIPVDSSKYVLTDSRKKISVINYFKENEYPDKIHIVFYSGTKKFFYERKFKS